MKSGFLAVVAALLLSSTTLIGARAEDAPLPAATQRPLTATEAMIKKVVEEKLKLTIDEVTPMPFGGLYELRFGSKVIYSDAKGEYLFVGNVIDLKNATNLTSARTDALADLALPKVKFSDLPASNAIKIVRGNGKRQMAIFEDPNCVYCKRLEKAISELDDVTVYVYLYPVLGDDSIAKAKNILCAKDPAKTWSAWMDQGTPIGNATGCNTSNIDKNLALGDKLEVTGTPTIFFTNGKRVPGAVSKDEIDKLLNAG
jgi:thiol:disulfide interchange protein DsbC